MIQSRRKFLFWLGKAPAIVAASSIMGWWERRRIERLARKVAWTGTLTVSLRTGGGTYFVSNDPSVDLIPINRNDGFIRHRVVARGSTA